ncbi:MAG: phytoene desaturase family protein [Spirulina sp.]
MSDRQTVKNYDIILIGSGMGALTVASLMTQLRNKRVLVLERHFQLGGFTQTFKRKGFHWDVGLHYVGHMGEKEKSRQLFDFITGGGVKWQKMPEPFEKFVYPGFSFDLYGDRQRYQQDLCDRFPAEEKVIKRYFKDLTKGGVALFLHAMKDNGSLPYKLMAQLAKLWHRTSLDLTTQEYLDRNFRDPQLKALLVSQWGTYGLPPEESPFAIHATIATHYLSGAYYPVGSSETIAQSVKAIVEERGGKMLVNREVSEILLDGKEAAGVRVRKVNEKEEHFEEYYAPVIISNTGAANTYLKLIPPNYPIPFRQTIKDFLEKYPPATHISLYIGLSDDPHKLGFQGENHWIYEQLDHNQTYRDRGKWVAENNPKQVYLSFPSLKDPEAKKHTAEIISFADYDSFSQWRDESWMHRDAEYKELKEKLARSLIGLVDRHYPGFADLIEYYEVSTPVTNEYFTDHPKGAMYGLSFVCDRFKPENQVWSRIKTPLPGLYQTGSDVYLFAIMGAMMGGVLTTTQLPDGLSLPEVFSQ